jgi:hypothetical protein
VMQILKSTLCSKFVWLATEFLRISASAPTRVTLPVRVNARRPAMDFYGPHKAPRRMALRYGGSGVSRASLAGRGHVTSFRCVPMCRRMPMCMLMLICDPDTP